jgi:hypothetical protein
MVQNAQYKIMDRTTNIDDILDLDDEEDNSQSRQISSKFIREKHVSPHGQSNYGSGPQGGLSGNRQQGRAQNMISSLHPSDSRYKQQQMQQNPTLQPSLHRSGNSVEQYEEISIQAVADRIFPKTSLYTSLSHAFCIV